MNNKNSQFLNSVNLSIWYVFFNEHLTNIIKIYIANDKVYIYKKLINCKLFENIMNDNNII